MTKDVIDRIRRSVDIIDVVEAIVPGIRKTGDNIMAPCPFLGHKDSKPSFSVSRSKQIYKCFGCQKGGNVFTFVMEMRGVSFHEAVRDVAAVAGISIDNQEELDEIELLYELHRHIAKATHKEAMSSVDKRAYFHERGLTDSTIQKFVLGVDSGNVLDSVAGFPSHIVKQSGYFYEREDGWAPAFNGRYTFPLITTAGKVAGMAGKSLIPIEAPYKNSSESRIFKKGSFLYGAYEAMQAIFPYTILVEGYFDVLTLSQGGFPNTVGLCGTSLTFAQAKMLSRLSSDVLLLLDSDPAGRAATSKAFPELHAAGLNVYVGTLPEKTDPDVLLLNDRAKFEDVLISAIPFWDWFIPSGLTGDGRDDKIQSVRMMALSIGEDVKRKTFVEACANRLGIREALLYSKGKDSLAGKQAFFGDREAMLISSVIANPLMRQDQFFASVRLKSPVLDEVRKSILQWGGEDIGEIFNGLSLEAADAASVCLTMAASEPGYQYVRSLYSAEEKQERVNQLLKAIKDTERAGGDCSELQQKLNEALHV